MTGTGYDKTDGQKREMLGKIISDASAAFLVTRSGNKGLHGRPMATAKVEDDISALWFSCQKDSRVVGEIAADSRVYLGYTNHTGSEWASINGTASIVTDRAKIRELWSPLWKNWFDGPDDPKIALIRVEPQEAEYWDSGSRAVMLLKMAFAAVTGTKVSDGEHERVEVGSRFSEDQKRVRMT
jgi:general stress protein 26